MDGWADVVSTVAAILSAVAATVAVAIAWFQLRAMRREQRLSRRPIIAVEPLERAPGQKFRFAVRNIGEGPAFDCSVMIFVMPVDELAKVTLLQGSDLNWRWRQSVGTLATGESKEFSIDGTPEEASDWEGVIRGEPIGFAWVANYRNLFEEGLRDEGRQWIESQRLLEFEGDSG